jgi:ATP-dependent Lon protease
MTGELTLTGRILPIGGLKEKLLAAIRNGMETAILPEDNRSEWEELDRDIKDGIRVQFATCAGEAFAVLFDGEILRGKSKNGPKTARAKAAARSGTQKKV